MYKIGFITNDNVLVDKFKSIDYFTSFKVGESFKNFEGVELDILIISDLLINSNELIQKIENYKNIKNVFYMISDQNYTDNKNNILKSKNIITIAPKLTNSQILEYVLEKATDGGKIDKKIVTFFGADNKVGTTMIAQSVAEEFSNQGIKILLCSLSGKFENEYINNPKCKGLDSLKAKLFNKILSIDEILDTCIKKDNLFILEGANYIPDLRHYHPEHIEYLFELISNEFDLIIIDAGSINIELGITIGALNLNKFRFLVTTQQESAFNRYSNLKESVLDKLQIDDFMLIINKCLDNEILYNAIDIGNRYKSTVAATIPYLQWGWQAESDKKTLLNYEDKEYISKISEVCKIISSRYNIEVFKQEEVKPSLFKKIFASSK